MSVLPKKENKARLPDALEQGVEELSGFDMDNVKIHYNSDKPTQIEAGVYTQGSEIRMAPEQQHHLPQAAWHIVQQKQGRVESTTGLEKEADEID